MAEDTGKLIGIVFALIGIIYFLSKWTNPGAQSALSLPNLGTFASTTSGMVLIGVFVLMMVVAFFIPKK